MAAPVLQTSTTNAGATAASVVVTIPSGVVAGDVVIVGIYKENANAVTPPAGYTEIPTAPSTTAVQAQHTFWHRAAGSESGTVTFSWTGSVFNAAAAHRISGCASSGNPYEGTLATNSSNTSVATLNVSIASTTAGSLLYWGGTDFTGGNVWTVPTGFGNLTDLDVFADAFKTNAAGGATGNVTGTANVSGPMTAVLLSLVPDAAGGSAVRPAAPGKSWLRRFHHRQLLLPLPAVAAAPQSGPPVYPLLGPVGLAWRAPGPFVKGRIARNPGTSAQAGAPVTPLRGPAGSRVRVLPPRGRITANRGTFAQAGPPVKALAAPVASRGRGLPPRGRTNSNDGTFAQLGPPVTPLRGPVGVAWRAPGSFVKGRARWNAGTYTAVTLGQGPPVYPLRGPVQARQPLGRRGRAARNPGVYAQAGPPVTPLRKPVTAVRPSQSQGGRCASRAGTFTATGIQAGPPVYPLHSPVRARQPLPPRGRCAANRGTFAQAGPPVTPLRHPVAPVRPSQLQGGRCRWNAGTYTQVALNSGAPVYPLRGPVRTRPQPPPRGRCASSRGIRHQSGPPVRPLRGPVAPFRPGPYRSGRCASQDGTYSQTGPRVYPLQRPVRARIPQRPRGGRTAANAGAPLFVPPFTIGVLTAADTARYALTAAAASNALTATTAASGTLTANDQRTGGPS